MSSKAATGLEISLSDVKVYVFIFALTKLLQVFGNVVTERVVAFLLRYVTKPNGKLNVRLIATVVTIAVVLLAYLWFTEQEKIMHYLSNQSRSSSPSSRPLIDQERVTLSIGSEEEQEVVVEAKPTRPPIPSIEEFKFPQMLPRIGCLGSFFLVLMIWLDLPWGPVVKFSIAMACIVLNLPLLWHSVGMYLMSGSLAIGLVMYSSIRKCCLKRKKRKQEQLALAKKLSDMRRDDDADRNGEEEREDSTKKTVKRIDADKYAVIKKTKKASQ
eukprot:TRINITY_DN3071_c0_g1_i1.p1 TRINITY_DN3071_c0_g1~~TRINITY_DN3071_c0_g1_i1.p1  ORF type:complete len:271 (-),score=71.97 TRINITY_DN3071_c0_g1_i1:74-886(-)